MGVVISMSGDRSTEPSIDSLLDLTDEDMAHVNALITSRTVSHVHMIPELAQHLINSGGKRLRPLLTIASAQMCGYTGRDHIKLAAAVEFMHTATLLHDDVVDESDLRRGKKTARVVWGNQASVLVGDFLLGQAFKMMVETECLEALRILSNAAAVIAEGEVLQLSTAQNVTTTEDQYLAVIRAKTAALFSAATEVGAVVSDQPKEIQETLLAYGNNLGIAFQLIDDALDYSGTEVDLGKAVGDDFREGKVTLPIVLSYRRGNDEERAFWRRTLEKNEIRDGDLQHAISLMTRNGAINDTIERAAHYGALARDALALFPESPQKQALLEVVDFCVRRVH